MVHLAPWLCLGSWAYMYSLTANVLLTAVLKQLYTNDVIVAHFLTDHTSANFTVEQCVESLKSCSDTVYEYGKLINDVFRSIIL